MCAPTRSRFKQLGGQDRTLVLTRSTDSTEGRSHDPSRRHDLSGGRMNVDDLILVSVDEHVIEPPDRFEGRLPKKHADRAPRVIRRDDGTDAWLYEGQRRERQVTPAAAQLGTTATTRREGRVG